MPRFRLFILLVVAATLLRLPSSCFAQSQPTDVTSSNSTGLLPYEASGGVRETINYGTGNLNLQVPLLSLPGRNGHNFHIALQYDSKIWALHSQWDPDIGAWYYWWDYEDNGFWVGWRLNFARLFSTYTKLGVSGSTYCYSQFVVTTPDGSKHVFGNRAHCVTGSPPVPAPSSDITVSDSNDAMFMRLDTSNESDIVLHLKDGGTIHFPTYTTTNASKLVDPDGNRIDIVQNGSTTTITDTLGRAITMSNGICTYKDSAGTSRSITITATNATLSPTFTNPPGSSPTPFTASLPSTVTLPNGLAYSFQYNNFGELTKITYPTGGYNRYDYAAYTVAGSADFREVQHRYVCRSASGSCASEDVSTYTPTLSSVYVLNQYMDVVDSLSNRTRYQFSVPTTIRFGNREIYRFVYSGQSTLLRTIQTDYDCLDPQGNPMDCSLPIRATTTLSDISPPLVSKTEWDYDTITLANSTTVPIDNVLERRDFDFAVNGPGALIRKADYAWLKTNPVNGQDYTSTAIHILNRKASEQIKDANGNILAQTQYEYDNYASDQKHAGLQASGAVQHDSAFTTTYTTRGNLTATPHWRNTDGVWLTTYNQYDDAGNLLKTIDPGTRPMSFGYSDSWNDATCTPTGGGAAAYRTSATNALSQTATSKFNSCVGTIASTTDLNSQAVSSTYDLMGRVTQTNFPDGGQTIHAFNESALPRGVSTTTKITSASNGVGTANVDGLGRVVQPQLNSDPQGMVYTDMTYDALGRKSSVSNPYRSPSESTYGITTYQYDVLGRTTKVIPPDGSGTANNVSTTYAGNCTTTTEQASKTRKVCSDALGRMTQVFEPNSSGSFVNETDYQYDVLDNLLCVHQRGTDTTADKACMDGTVPATWRPRTFTYNSLSQLLTTTNPESGTITYTYDADGSVLTKTDARGIITTVYYDVLHRLTKKTFSDSTPQVTYWYDGQTPSGCSPTLTATNPIGKRTAMCDAAGWEAWSYDVMGRVLTERRNTNGVTKDTTYTYNLDGSLATITYPSGRVITYTVNAAGRAISVVDAANNINYATSATYNAFGTLASLQNGGSLYSTFLFNTRLQPCWLYINTSSSGSPTTCTQTGVAAAAVMDLKYDFGLGVNDNGNVNGFTNNRNTARSQAFTFDELNRLKTALTQATSGSQCFGLDYAYDIWGNLTATSLDSSRSSCSWTTLSVGVSTNNRITNTGSSYDAAGNVLSDGSFTYTWDAESQLMTAGSVTYTYDGDGRRVQKSNGKLYWYGATGDILDETDASGNLTNEYIYFGGKRIARRDSSNTVYYYFADHLGSSRVITQANGTVCYDADYDPFGKEVVVANTCSQNYKFNGKERDTETNLDDFGARYYSSQFGRWTSPDWSGGPSTVPYAELVNPQSLNLYSYVRNNPVTSADLDGHMYAQDTMSITGSDLGGQGSWSPRGPEEQDTGRWLDTTDYSSGRMSLLTYQTVMSNGEIVTTDVIVFNSQLTQPQNQNNQQAQQNQQNTAPANSRTDVVLHGREYTPTPQVETPALWVMDWTASACSATGCSRPTAANEKQTITLVESENGGPWKKGGDPSQGVAHDHFSVEPRSINQHWSVDGKRVQLVVGKDSKGNLIKSWEVRVDIKKFGDRPVYSAVP